MRWHADSCEQYCANMGMTIWCPSTAAIQRMNAHVEEDIQLAQEELAALAAKGRDCQHLLKCESSPGARCSKLMAGVRPLCAAYSEILLGCEAEQSEISCHLGEFSLLSSSPS